MTKFPPMTALSSSIWIVVKMMYKSKGMIKIITTFIAVFFLAACASTHEEVSLNEFEAYFEKTESIGEHIFLGSYITLARELNKNNIQSSLVLYFTEDKKSQSIGAITLGDVEQIFQKIAPDRNYSIRSVSSLEDIHSLASQTEFEYISLPTIYIEMGPIIRETLNDAGFARQKITDKPTMASVFVRSESELIE